ncbi:RNA-directed DNA polymerase, eukaryota [Tanacetum coccineum]
MKGISLNCNGLGSDSKKSWIRGLVESEFPIFFGVQETKLDCINPFFIRSLWSRPFVEFACSESSGVVGSWIGCRHKIGLLNIYAPQPSNLKEALWNSIEVLINSVEAAWIVFGDFNVVRNQEERSGSSFNVGEENVFNDFISRVGLFDFPLGGRRFTRFGKNGNKASKLDRFLVSNNFFDCWNDASVLVLCRSFSDHCPLLLKVGSPNFGPKPFRIFDKWIGDPDFSNLISNSWVLPSAVLTPDLVLKNKLKNLRQVIKTWTYTKVSAPNKIRDDIISHLSDWDVKAEDGLINDLKQKCRLRWAVEGDENSKFFHSLLQCKYSKFNLKGVHINGVWCDSPEMIKEAAVDHFSLRFKENPIPRPYFNSPLFRRLSLMDANSLEATITMDELKEAVWGCAGCKAPGPDGFNFNFIKNYWETLKFDFWNCVKYFESTGNIANGCNPSFIVLIPKKGDPLGFSDYRPISLIGCVYKVISKILANRLSKVISSVIGPNQTAFIAGRQILDGCLIANEIIRTASLEKLKLLLFKVDFEKAFDSVNWNFLQDIMRQMGFGAKWRKWMASCLSSASISILVNGSPSKEFKLERGLPLGLKVNISKSRIIGIGVPTNEVELMASSLGCAHESLPFIYLGLPVGKKMRLCGRLTLVKSVLGSLPLYYFSLFKALAFIIKTLESIRSRFFWGFDDSLSGINWVKWSSILLDASKGGLGVGSLEAKNLALLGKLKWRFLTDTNALWRKVIKELYGNNGGFSFAPISLGPSGVWCDILSSVTKIEAMDDSFKSSFWVKVSSGSDTLFWKDPWSGNGSRLMDVFPRLFALENYKDYTVKDRWAYDNGVWEGSWSWRVSPRGRALDDLSSLLSLINHLSLSSNDCDRWFWSGDASGKLKVKSLSTSIQNICLGASARGVHHIWNSWIPKKVNICVWRASLNRLPTRSNLANRGLILSSTCCPFCDDAQDEITHCGISCPRVLPVWSWWNLPSPVVFPSFSVADVAMGKIDSFGGSRLNKVLHGVLQCTLWSI